MEASPADAAAEQVLALLRQPLVVKRLAHKKTGELMVPVTAASLVKEVLRQRRVDFPVESFAAVKQPLARFGKFAVPLVVDRSFARGEKVSLEVNVVKKL